MNERSPLTGNLTCRCAVCSARFEDYAAKLALPTSWLMYLSESTYGDDDRETFNHLKYASAFVEVCPDCEKRCNRLRMRTWAVSDPTRLDTLTQDYIDRIPAGLVIDVEQVMNG